MPSPQLTPVDRAASELSRWVIAKRWTVLLLCVLVTGVIGSNARLLTVADDYRVFFSDENPQLNRLETFQDTYSSSENLFFYVRPTDGRDVFDRKVLLGIEALTREAWQIPYSTRVDSITNFQNTYARGDDLVVEALVDDSGALDDDALLEKRAIALGEPLLNGSLIDAQARVTAVNVIVNHPKDSPDALFESVVAARELRDQIMQAYPELEIRLTGNSMLDAAFVESTIADNSTLVPAMFALVVLLTLLVLRSWAAALTVTAVVACSLIVALGVGGMMGVSLTPISLSATVIVLTLAVADSIHILLSLRGNQRAGMGRERALIEAMRVNFLAVGITSLSTAVGFLALNTSDAPPFWHLGNMSAAGIAAAWALSITLLPALISVLPTPRPTADQGRAEDPFRMGALARLTVTHKWACAAVALSLSLGLITQIPRIEFNDQWTRYFDQRIAFRRDTDAATEHFGMYPVEFSVPAGAPGAIAEPAYMQRLDRFAKWLETQDGVLHVYSVADVIKRLNQNVHQDDPAFDRLPESAELAAQYLLLYELSLPYGLDTGDRISIDKSATRLTATLSDVTTAQTKAFLHATECYLDEHFPADLRPHATSAHVMFTFITDRNVNQMMTGTVLAILAIAAIMVVALRDIRLGLLSLVPNVLPILAAFGAWGLLVGSVGFSIAVVAAISLGIVVDDTVHLMSKYARARRERAYAPPDAIAYAFHEVGSAIVVNTIILSAGFALLMFSSFKLTSDMGLLTGLSIVLALVLDFLLLPALLIATDRRAVREPQAGAVSAPDTAPRRGTAYRRSSTCRLGRPT